MNTCKTCGKTYTTYSNLKRHLKTPCKIKITEWRCKFCKKYYAAECSLKKHMKDACLQAQSQINNHIFNNSDNSKYSVDSNLIDSEPYASSKYSDSSKVSEPHTSSKYSDSSKDSEPHTSSKYSEPRHSKSKSKQKIILKPRIHYRPPLILQRGCKNQPVVFDDIFGKLSEIMGDKQALEFLLTKFLDKNFEKIVSACYLQELPSESYPIACSGENHFRFLDENGILIDDPTGDKLVKKIINNIQNALLRANYLLIKKYIGEKDSSQLYEVYDIRAIQNGIYDLFKPTNHNKMKRYLAKRMLNPNHYFFPDIPL